MTPREADQPALPSLESSLPVHSPCMQGFGQCHPFRAANPPILWPRGATRAGWIQPGAPEGAGQRSAEPDGWRGVSKDEQSLPCSRCCGPSSRKLGWNPIPALCVLTHRALAILPVLSPLLFPIPGSGRGQALGDGGEQENASGIQLTRSVPAGSAGGGGDTAPARGEGTGAAAPSRAEQQGGMGSGGGEGRSSGAEQG